MRHINQRARTLQLACLATLIPLGCQEPPPPEPVARVSVELHGEQLPYPEWRTLRLQWEPLEEIPVPDEAGPEKPAPGELFVFLHLLDKESKLVRTFDHALPDPWQVNATIGYEVQIYQSALAAPLPAGTYDLTLGLYFKGGQRFHLTGVGDEVGRQEYRVATLTVPPISSEAPSFSFPPPWMPPEAGTDSQILSRRHLSSEGRTIIENLEVPGSLWLRLLLPPVIENHQELVLSEAGVTPTLEVTSTCSGIVRSLAMPGEHEIVLPVFPVGDTAECEITWSSNYKLRDSLSMQERVASLEVVAWTGAEL